jgi:hypothetical protein
MPMKPETKEMVDKMQVEMRTKDGGVYFDWQKFDCIAMDTPTKLHLLGLIYKDWEKLQEEDQTDKSFNMDRPVKIGQAIWLFRKISLVPEIDP